MAAAVVVEVEGYEGAAKGGAAVLEQLRLTCN